MVSVVSVPEWWMHHGEKTDKWTYELLIPSPHCANLWGQYYGVGLLQLVRSAFSDVMGPPKKIKKRGSILQDDNVRNRPAQIVKDWFECAKSHFLTRTRSSVENLQDVLNNTFCLGPILTPPVQKKNVLQWYISLSSNTTVNVFYKQRKKRRCQHIRVNVFSCSDGNCFCAGQPFTSAELLILYLHSCCL